MVDNGTNHKYPSIDLLHCSKCLGCVEIAPTVFDYNEALGVMEVLELPLYPVSLVDEAIKNCPRDCIGWVAQDKTLD
ncbi:MAG: ferredoxin [Deltaproteobacteria bacterium]|nr:MAG: ferredoxin [Deltaproteobacteria bacterium]PIE73150.1 MAG: ferredoxin [Deltaproteobacteria bacterium]